MTSTTKPLPGNERADAEAIARLSILARAHGAESRAADVVAEKVLIGRFRFSPALGWFEWDGRRWDSDDIAEPRVVEAVRAFIDETERDLRATQAEAEGELETLQTGLLGRLGDDQRDLLDGAKLATITKALSKVSSSKEIEQWTAAMAAAEEAKRQADVWLNLLSASKISNITKLCRGMPGIITRASEFDAHPDLLNCRNCVADLRTGEQLPHDQGLLLTHLTGGDYDPAVASPLWAKALDAVHPEAAEWFQLKMGQSLTGHTPDDDSLTVCFGGGSNGKSAIMSAVLRAAGSYGRLISHRVLISQPGQHPTELMDLRGLRLAVLEETAEEGHLDTHQLKTTIGTPQITARKMRRDDVTFNTSHTLWINTNHLPQVDSTDHGTWRRLRAMPWPFRFVKPGLPLTEANDRPGDLTLKARLATDLTVPTAVLSWMVEGARRWYDAERASPQNPTVVEQTTRAWRASTDVGYLFATEWLIADPHGFITADAMRAAFTGFLVAQGKRAWSAQTLNNRLPDSMAEAGILVDRTPASPTKVRAADVQSGPPGELTRESIGFFIDKQVQPDKAVRIWRGVRFRLPTERGRGERLSVVS